jgi:hypothetical protein
MENFCEAKIRPMPNATEIQCGLTGEHDRHEGVLRDYAYPGSATKIVWDEDDRRTFRGDWSPCPLGCILPFGHRGRHAR